MKHTIFYDAGCPLCVREMELVLSDRRAAEFDTVPVQGSEAILRRHGISPAQAMTYLHILRGDGTMVRGMAAVRLMHEHAERFTPVKLANLPLIRAALRPPLSLVCPQPLPFSTLAAAAPSV